MDYSFSTVYMAIIASNILLILLTFFFRNKKIMLNAGYRILAIFVVLTLIRFLLPIEMPFTKTIALPEWISLFISRIRHVWFTIGTLDITIWLFLQIIWLLGFGIKLVLYICSQLQSRYYILSNMWDVSYKEPYLSLLDEICTVHKRKNKFRVAEVSGLKIPVLYGIVRPYILLPKEQNISENELYYILAHEASHHFHHDLITKFLVRFIDMAYWWNPFCHILTKQTDMILEMRIDNVITDSEEHSIQDYLHCLIQLKESITGQNPVSDAVSMPLFNTSASDDDEDLVKRFEMLVSSNQKKKHSLNIAFVILVLSLYLSSYAFIFEAFYATPQNIENTFTSTATGLYAIQKEDNSYDIYYDDLLFENTDSLEYYEGIQIYTEKEIHHEEH